MPDPLLTTRVLISTDVTDWPPAQREELLKTIRAYQARFASSDVDDDVESTGWTKDAYYQAIKSLLGSHFVQANVINEAIRNGGVIDRAQVYELAEYPESRSLKGFTRPVNRQMTQLVDSGVLPEEAADLLEPIYDPEVKGFQRAKGFRVPAEIVNLIRDANDGQWPAAS